MLNIYAEHDLNFGIKFNQSKSFLFQIGLAINEVLLDLYLCGVALKWVKCLRYLGVWLSAGKIFTVDSYLNCTKFVGSTISLLQKSACLSEEIKWHVIQHSCWPLMMHGIDSVILCSEQIRKLSVANNNVVRRCFGLSRFSSVRNLLYFLGSMLLNMLLDCRRILLVKECLSCNSILRLLAYLATDHSNFNALCLKYDVHCNMSIGFIKSAFIRVLLSNLEMDNLV